MPARSTEQRWRKRERLFAHEIPPARCRNGHPAFDVVAVARVPVRDACDLAVDASHLHGDAVSDLETRVLRADAHDRPVIARISRITTSVAFHSVHTKIGIERDFAR